MVGPPPGGNREDYAFYEEFGRADRGPFG
jgi:hypothetical protein